MLHGMKNLGTLRNESRFLENFRKVLLSRPLFYLCVNSEKIIFPFTEIHPIEKLTK